MFFFLPVFFDGEEIPKFVPRTPTNKKRRLKFGFVVKNPRCDTLTKTLQIGWLVGWLECFG